MSSSAPTSAETAPAARRGRGTGGTGGARVARFVVGGLIVLWSTISMLLLAGPHGTPGIPRLAAVAVWILCVYLLARHAPPLASLIALPTLALAIVWGLRQIPPRLDRSWAEDHAQAPSVALDGDLVTIGDFRSFRHSEDGQIEARWESRTFDLGTLEGCDYIVVPFPENPKLAHTMVSFRFAEGPNLALSVEARREVGEAYSVVRALFRQYELIYVIGNEEDLLGSRLFARGDALYLHPVVADVAVVRSFLVDLLMTAAELHGTPRWYHTLRSNCTTSLVQSFERARGERLPWDLRILLPGGSDELVYDLGILESTRPFADLRREARVDASLLEERSAVCAVRENLSTLLRHRSSD
ncbi:DUF4105 domain-containing protein [Saltatorellus ferox]|uniref:Lnb N-terminal periplasmic domain-containing protein n=1 Tax=Saltatorellus ferox TaxID=2528018 RepID=UPI003AF40AF0